MLCRSAVPLPQDLSLADKFSPGRQKRAWGILRALEGLVQACMPAKCSTQLSSRCQLVIIAHCLDSLSASLRNEEDWSIRRSPLHNKVSCCMESVFRQQPLGTSPCHWAGSIQVQMLHINAGVRCLRKPHLASHWMKIQDFISVTKNA